MVAWWRVPKNGWVRKQEKTDRRNDKDVKSAKYIQNIQKCPGHNSNDRRANKDSSG